MARSVFTVSERPSRGLVRRRRPPGPAPARLSSRALRSAVPAAGENPMRTALLLVLVVLVSSCAFMRETENEPLVPASVQSLRPGVSTAEEVVTVLGAPVDVVQLGRR